MFDNLFQVAGPMWAVVPMFAAIVAFGTLVFGFDARTLRALGRRS